MPNNILVIGSGAREHAILWQLAQSRRRGHRDIGQLYAAPGNAGTARLATNLPIQANDVLELCRFAKSNQVRLTIVGPEAPLAMGIVDAFRARGLLIFGPTRSAAEIEWSKDFGKRLMQQNYIPTAHARMFDQLEQALDYVNRQSLPLVIKASGLAAGKGVYICHTVAEAEAALQALMHDGAHNCAGSTVVIEEYLEGEEISVHAFCDGRSWALTPPAQDHKRVFDGDRGPNTGGMGAIAPVPWTTPELLNKIGRIAVAPALNALNLNHRVFRGVLFPGLMVTDDGPKVLEYNARFGDPEASCLMRLLQTSLFDIVEACLEGSLSELPISWRPGFAVSVVLASGGYPGRHVINYPITGLAQANKVPGVVIFHAATKTIDGQLYTAGGRVLNITATGRTLQEALNRAYRAVGHIHFYDMHYRTDIGAKALTRNT